MPEHVEVISGKLTFLRCRSKGWEGGGGLYVSEGDLLQHGGATHFQDCKAASGGGGGVHIQQGALQLLAGRMSFERCAADGAQGGGGLLLTQGDFGSPVVAFLPFCWFKVPLYKVQRPQERVPLS